MSDERKVVMFCKNHKDRHGDIPSVRTVAKETGISKTKVGDIMKPLRAKWST
jgi:hypothetical protein